MDDELWGEKADKGFWEEEVDESITTEKLDALVTEMYQAQIEYNTAKEVSNTANAIHVAAKERVVKYLQAAGKTKYHVDGVGSCTVTSKMKVRTPKTTDEKSLLFGWIREVHGEEAATAYSSINYASLNKLYNEAYEESESKSDFTIPGIEPPEVEFGLQFRKK